MMRVLILICCLASIVRAAPKKGVCEGGIRVGENYYDLQQVLKGDIDRAYQLVVNTKTNTLFFSYSVGNNEEDTFKSAYIDITSNNFTDIPDITDGFAAAVDPEKGTVYLGGSDGIYTFDEVSKSAVPAKAKGKNIWALFYKDHLYYIDYPESNLYEYKGEEATIVPEFANKTITQFAIDKSGERFFVNDTGLYGLESGANIEKAKLYNDKVAIRGIAVNREGKVYICGENGIYTLDSDKKFKHIAAISNTFGLAFDKDDNIIYATDTKIIRLTPSKECNDKISRSNDAA